jgi:hypothetical protein
VIESVNVVSRQTERSDDGRSDPEEPTMLRSTLCPTAAALWLTAVLGAVALLVGPITPWCAQVELVGMAACVIASAALFAWFLHRE